MISTNTVSQNDFLAHLSAQDGRVFYGYNNGFQIEQHGRAFTIQEISKGWCNPFGVHSDDDRKLQTANNLQRLVTGQASVIVKAPALNANQMVKVLERYRGLFTAGMQDVDKRTRVFAAFNGAIQALNNALRTEAFAAARTNVSTVGKTQWDPRDFLHKLEKTWITGRPNFQLHLQLDDATQRINPMTARKLWFFEKPFRGRASSQVQKLAQMENLKEFIHHHLPYIVGARLDTAGIEANISRLADRMKANMSVVGQNSVDQTVTHISAELRRAQIQINKDRYYDPQWRIWQGIKFIVSTPKNLLWDHSDHLFAPIGAAALGWTAEQFAPGLFGSIVHNVAGNIEPDSLTSYLTNPAVALGVVSSISFLAQRVFYPATKGAGQALMARVRPTRVYQWSARATGAVTYGASFIPWVAKGTWSGTKTLGSIAKNVVVFPFHELATLLNNSRQVMA